jgi:hypothetical protein
LAVENNAPALAAEVVVRLQERNLVPGAAEQRRGGEPPNPAAHDY